MAGIRNCRSLSHLGMLCGCVPTLAERCPEAILSGVSVAIGVLVLFAVVEPHGGKLHEGEHSSLALVLNRRAGVESNAEGCLSTQRVDSISQLHGYNPVVAPLAVMIGISLRVPQAYRVHN